MKIPPTAIARRLEHHCILEAAGEDAGAWLNGQITNDLKGATEQDGVFALFVSLRGKVLTDTWVFRIDDERYWITVPQSTTAELLERFDGQIIMEDVEVEPVEATGIITVQGEGHAAAREALGALLRDELTKGKAAIRMTDRLHGGGFDLAYPTVKAADVEALLGRHNIALLGDDAWAAAHVRERRPRFGVDYDHRHYPQEAGLKDRAVSFSKGCYYGQEVVCTLESRGKLSKRLVALHGPTQKLTEGAELRVGDDAVGNITSHASAKDGIRALGYLRAKFADTAQVEAQTTDGSSVTLTIEGPI